MTDRGGRFCSIVVKCVGVIEVSFGEIQGCLDIQALKDPGVRVYLFTNAFSSKYYECY